LFDNKPSGQYRGLMVLREIVRIKPFWGNGAYSEPKIDGDGRRRMVYLARADSNLSTNLVGPTRFTMEIQIWQ